MKDTDLYYKTNGNPAHPPIVFLHGFLGSSQEFAAIATALEKAYYCLRIDLPGHGQTHCSNDWEEDWGMEHTAVAIAQLLTRHHLSQCTLVGYSLGGRLALHLALNFPDRFPKVVIESASPGLKTESERQSRLQKDIDLADQIETDFPRFLEAWYTQPLFAALKRHPNFAEIPHQRSQNSPVQLATALRHLSISRQPSQWEKLAHHPNPLLLIVGDGDRKFVEINQAIAEQTPLAQLAIIPHSGHVVHIEQPAAYLACITAFLAA